jgi:hypothetical protein
MAVVLSALTADTVEKLIVVLVAVLVVGGVLVLRSTVKLYTKIAMILVFGGLGVALFQNRVELGRCSQTCACTIYGHAVEVPHLPFSCDY